jgi:ribbon-helix-helix CopG family protein
MVISVRLDAKTEQLVNRLAKKRGRGKSELLREAIQLLARYEQGALDGESPFDAISDLVGCASGGPRNASVRTGERFRALLAARTRRR